jgi:hypothetical protein
MVDFFPSPPMEALEQFIPKKKKKVRCSSLESLGIFVISKNKNSYLFSKKEEGWIIFINAFWGLDWI